QRPVARDGSSQLWGESIVLTSTGRRVLQMTSEALVFLRPASSARPAGATPRWPDGTPRLGPAPGERGYWGRPSATSSLSHRSGSGHLVPVFSGIRPKSNCYPETINRPTVGKKGLPSMTNV